MNRKNIIWVIVIAFFVGTLGSVVFTQFIFPPLATIKGFAWVNRLVSNAPIIVTRTQEVQFTEGVDLANLIKQTGNITVSIYDSKNNFLGNGIIVTSDGLIFTSLDAIQKATAFFVVTNDGQKFPAVLKIKDTASGTALLAAQSKGLTSAQFDNAANLEAGQRILYIGRGNIKFEHEILVGFVTQSLSNELGTPQVSADVAPGADFLGGPIVNLSGHVVGLVLSNSRNIVSENLQPILSQYLKK